MLHSITFSWNILFEDKTTILHLFKHFSSYNTAYKNSSYTATKKVLLLEETLKS